MVGSGNCNGKIQGEGDVNKQKVKYTSPMFQVYVNACSIPRVSLSMEKPA